LMHHFVPALSPRVYHRSIARLRRQRSMADSPVKDDRARADTQGSMNAGETVYLVSRLGTAALAAFLAIVLWSRTRDLAWMLIVIGVISSYADIVFSLLARLGLVDERRFELFGLPLGRILLSNLPFLFLCAALAIMIRRKRLR